ncbi:MAG: hypothetical protein OEO84_00005 [Betaproteobacteria bacterium]|nr:hypothetical protein [Betaproteobacteria bacterium]
MELKIRPRDIRWWFWAVTLAFIVAAIAGWTWGYFFVMAISGIQVLFFWAQERSFSAFPTQVRIAYFGLTLFGLWPEVRLFMYGLLLLGTIMVTFFDRCFIARVLKVMPWNRSPQV